MIDEAVEAIRAGRPVILPTDTVYGLCTTASSPEAVARLYRLKGRAETQPTPTSRTRGSLRPARRARHRSTTISVSGRGTSARRSVVSVSRRKPHSPRT